MVALRGGIPARHHARLETPNRDIEKTANRQASLLARRPERAAANSTASLLRKPKQLMSSGQNRLICLSAMTDRNMTSDQNVMNDPGVMTGLPIKTSRHSIKKVANPHLPRILALTHSPNPRPAASQIASQLTGLVASLTADDLAKSRIANRVATTLCGAEGRYKYGPQPACQPGIIP
jgi:hypothetical protein